MKILFYPLYCTPFNARTLKEKPLGETETSVIQLVEALKEAGHQLHVISTLLDEASPIYIPVQQAWNLENIDLMIGVRSWESFWQPFKAKKKLLWIMDGYDHALTLGLGDARVNALFDTLLCVSEWQRETLCLASGYPKAKTYLLGHGVDLSLFKQETKKCRKRMVTLSPSDPDLLLLGELLIKLKPKHRDLELHILNPQPSQTKILELFQSIPGCVVQQNMPLSGLVEEFMQAAIFLHPSSRLLASCGTIIQAQAAGCCVVTSTLGALPEIVRDSGLLIFKPPLDAGFISQFIEAVDKLLTDEETFRTLSEKAGLQSQNADWRTLAKQLINWLQ